MLIFIGEHQYVLIFHTDIYILPIKILFFEITEDYIIGYIFSYKCQSEGMVCWYLFFIMTDLPQNKRVNILEQNKTLSTSHAMETAKQYITHLRKHLHKQGHTFFNY